MNRGVVSRTSGWGGRRCDEGRGVAGGLAGRVSRLNKLICSVLDRDTARGKTSPRRAFDRVPVARGALFIGRARRGRHRRRPSNDLLNGSRTRSRGRSFRPEAKRAHIRSRPRRPFSIRSPTVFGSTRRPGRRDGGMRKSDWTAAELGFSSDSRSGRRLYGK